MSIALSDDDLLRAAVSGQTDPLAELLRRCGAELTGRIDSDIPRGARRELSADDVLQVTFLEVWLGIGKFRPGSAAAFRAWVWQIAKNNLTDAFRGLDAEKRPPAAANVANLAASDESYVRLLENLTAGDRSPSSMFDARENVTRLKAALADLPPDYRTAVTLIDLDGLSGFEAAERMGRSRGAVYMLRQRGRTHLRDQLVPPG